MLRAHAGVIPMLSEHSRNILHVPRICEVGSDIQPRHRQTRCQLCYSKEQNRLFFSISFLTCPTSSPLIGKAGIISSIISFMPL